MRRVLVLIATAIAVSGCNDSTTGEAAKAAAPQPQVAAVVAPAEPDLGITTAEFQKRWASKLTAIEEATGNKKKLDELALNVDAAGKFSLPGAPGLLLVANVDPKSSVINNVSFAQPAGEPETLEDKLTMMLGRFAFSAFVAAVTPDATDEQLIDGLDYPSGAGGTSLVLGPVRYTFMRDKGYDILLASSSKAPELAAADDNEPAAAANSDPCSNITVHPASAPVLSVTGSTGANPRVCDFVFEAKTTIDEYVVNVIAYGADDTKTGTFPVILRDLEIGDKQKDRIPNTDGAVRFVAKPR